MSGNESKWHMKADRMSISVTKSCRCAQRSQMTRHDETWRELTRDDHNSYWFVAAERSRLLQSCGPHGFKVLPGHFWGVKDAMRELFRQVWSHNVCTWPCGFQLMAVHSHIATMRFNKLQHVEMLCLLSDYPGVCCGAGTLLELEWGRSMASWLHSFTSVLFHVLDSLFKCLLDAY